MCTLTKRGNIFVLTLTGATADDQHRLNPTTISAIRSALADAKSRSTPGCALVTVSSGKFFSNGFDLNWTPSMAGKDVLSLMVEYFKPLIAELISLPMPTVAAVNGHAAGAGVLFATGHDYVIMRKDRGVMYMSEIDMGVTLPDYFNVMVAEKVGSQGRRDFLLVGRKVRAGEGVAMGLIDIAVDGEEAVLETAMKKAEELGKRRWSGEVYAEIRKGLYPKLCAVLGLSTKTIVPKL